MAHDKEQKCVILKAETYICIPNASVIDDDNNPYVYIYEKGGPCGLVSRKDLAPILFPEEKP